MCGIAGVWGAPIRTFGSMIDAMHHRGPDHHNVFQDDHVQLGMTRLSIQDLSDAAHQPMRSPDGNVFIIFNGEMYNFKEERDRLSKGGYQFRSQGDTEVVLALYLMHGNDFVTFMRGMFAVAIYDRRRGKGGEQLILARDHFGIKPLLYTTVNNRIIFASELKVLLKSEIVNPTIDSVALWQLLTHGAVRQPYTMIENVKMLPPAHRLVITRYAQRLEKFWSFGDYRHKNLGRLPYEEVKTLVKDELTKSVSLQLISDAPIGAFLSGGIDSSLLVALMAQQNVGVLKTYSVGFEAEGANLDETDDAQEVAEHIGTDHTKIIVRGENIRDSLESLTSGLDQPSVDGVNTYFISQKASQDVKVAISGTGGDELFAGYPWFASMVKHQNQNQQHFLLKWMRNHLSFNRRNKTDGFLSEFSLQYKIFGGEMSKRLLSQERCAAITQELDELVDYIRSDELPHSSTLNRTSVLTLRGYTINQLLRDIDSASMAHSLEVRVPFLDPIIADIAFSLPDHYKLHSLKENMINDSYASLGIKKILLDIGRPLLPKGFDQRSKRGFGMPFHSWLAGPLKEILYDTLSPSNLKNHNLLSAEATKMVLNQFEQGQIHWTQPWLLLMLETWYQSILSDSIKSYTGFNAPNIAGKIL